MEHHAENKPICLSAPCQFAAGEEGNPRRLEGVAYLGDVVTHDWAGRVVFDLAGPEEVTGQSWAGWLPDHIFDNLS